MNPALRHWTSELARGLVVALLLLSTVALLVDAVEQARLVVAESMAVGEVTWRVLARWPGLVWRVLPVAAATGAALVTRRWRQDRRVEMIEALGISTGRLVWLAALAGWAVGGATTLGREAIAPAAAQVLAGRDAWVQLDDEGDVWHVRAEHLGKAEARGIVAVKRRGGVALAHVRGDAAYVDGRWTTGAGVGWDGSPSEVSWVLPTPAQWRQLALPAGVDAPVRRLLAEPTPTIRQAWLVERALTLLAVGLWSALGVAVVLRGGRGAVMAVLGAAVLWRLTVGGLVLGVARGSWPAAAVVLLAVGTPSLWLAWATSRAGRSR